MGKRVIEKKVWPEFFQALVERRKRFELRLADFPCAAGDVLVLREWNPRTKQYTGRSLRRTVKRLTRLQPGRFWSVESIKKHGLYILEV